MGIINVLPTEISDKIAAGEVVERPASVVKELVENAIDAGATAITCEIKKGGITYIRVADNGKGMSRRDAELAFLRHATSKIRSANDLDAIYTLGFRGEALSSIGAVSETELFTKRICDEAGTHLECKGGKISPASDMGVPDGTTFIVNNLFYNTPARMNFLKKDSAEGAAITDIMERFILSHPEISFRYIQDGKDKYFTAGDSGLEACVYAVYGKSYAKSVIPIHYESELVTVTGIIGKSDTARPNRAYQSFYVNKRYIKSMRLSMAVENAYKNQIMVGKHPMAVLNLEINPKNVDVNVHPTKLEAKFFREDDIMRAVYHAVQNGLYQIPDIPEIEHKPLPKSRFEKDTVTTRMQVEFEEMQRSASSMQEPKIRTGEPVVILQNTEKTYAKPANNEYFREKQGEFIGEKIIEQKVAETPDDKQAKNLITPQVPEVYKKQLAEAEIIVEEPIFDPEAFYEKWGFRRENVRVIGQVFDTYILAASGDIMIIADQHAAHERLKYEELKRELKKRCVSAQMLLIPQEVKLSPSEMAVWRDNSKRFSDMGFELEEFRDNTLLVRATPEAIDPDELDALIIELIDKLSDTGKELITAKMERALYTIACKAAVKANHTYDTRQLSVLLNSILELDGINTCPHGRPIIITMTKKELEKEFKRIV